MIFQSGAALLLVLLAVPASAFRPTFNHLLRGRGQEVQNAVAACQRLSSTFPSAVYWPNTQDYIDETTAIYSTSCILSPNCVFEPSSANDVSTAVKILRQTKSKFAVRAGGHMPVPGAQSTQPGVLIALSKLNQKTYANANKTVASIGPGQTWIEVYQWAATSGLAVNGGRYPTVGVGGVLTGGGIGYFSSTKGWGVDTVVGFEIVLANGQIVNATSSGPHSDLFWAVRGGHNNYGIVTRFDLKTFPVGPAYIGGAMWDATGATGQSVQDQFFGALTEYLKPGGGVDDPNVATSAIIALSPANLDAENHPPVELISIQMAPGTDAKPRAFENFTKIEGPTVQELPGSVVPSWTLLPQALAQFGERGKRHVYWSVSFKPDPRAVMIANRTVTELAFGRMNKVRDAAVAFTYQPVSKDWLEASRAAGGNVLNLDPAGGTFVAGLLAITWTNSSDDDTVYRFCKEVGETIERETRKLGLYHPFVYLNDAHPWQKPFRSYGGNVLHRLKAIQHKYDPDGFLKRHLAHGFEIE